jgi:dihydroxy-acid dehydratase
MAELAKKDLLNLSVRTSTGKTLGENLQGVKIQDPRVIRAVENPYHAQGGIAILYGNLAPNGSVVKQSAVAPEMMVNTGRARCFDSEEAGIEAILGGRIQKGHVVVIRYEGPRGGPGMREMLGPTSVIAGMGLDRFVSLITDGRFSGASRGAAIGHISPEAAEGGPIALVEDDDSITIDIPRRMLTLNVSEEVLNKRRQNWHPPEPKIKEGYLYRYSRMVTSASTGAILKI